MRTGREAMVPNRVLHNMLASLTMNETKNMIYAYLDEQVKRNVLQQEISTAFDNLN
jgi:hypothetical protein